MLKKISLSQNEFVSEQVMNMKGHKVYKYTKKRIKWHKKMGHRVIFISGSPDFLVSKMAKKWEADDFIGTTYHIKDGKFSGETTPMWDSESKIKAVDYFEKKYNLNLDECYAYGDTGGDFGMLNLVGNPYAINPSLELLKQLTSSKKIKDKINIIVERKDVAYKFNGCVEFNCVNQLAYEDE